MQGIGKLVLDRARDALPMHGIVEPVGAVRGESPGANLCDAVREGIDVTISPIGVAELPGDPVVRYSTLAHQESIEGHCEVRMRGGGDLAIVGKLTCLP